MKTIIPILAMCLCSACATRSPEKSDQVAATTTTISAPKKTPSVRTSETVKAYPVGRYTDPNYPNAMHERHTLYRRERSPDWNYLPDAPYSLPMGPTLANSNPSPSYYVTTDSEMMNAQQRAYADALQEQNRVLKQRIESLQQKGGEVPELEQEIRRLRKELDAIPTQPPVMPSAPKPAEATSEVDDFFSSADPPLPAWDTRENLSDSSLASHF